MTSKVLAKAASLAEVQATARRAGEPLIRPSEVVRALQRAAIARPVVTSQSAETLLSSTKKPMMRVVRKFGGTLTIDILPKSGADTFEILRAIEALLSQPQTPKKRG